MIQIYPLQLFILLLSAFMCGGAIWWLSGYINGFYSAKLKRNPLKRKSAVNGE